MKIVQKFIYSILGFLFLLVPVLALADGAPIPKPDYYVTETDQKAVIIEEDGQETLILSTTFKGDAKDFAWIIPVPNEPEVSKSYDDIFNGLADLSKVESERIPMSSVPMLGALQKEEAPVKIVKTEKIDIYDVTTLTSTDEGALAKWLSDNGYQFPDSGTPILEDYIDNDWYFVAVKIDPSRLTKSAEDQLVTGHATPLKLTFETQKLVYPLKISSIVAEYEPKNISRTQNQNDDSDSTGETTSIIKPKVEELISIQLFILSDHKKEAPSFSTLFASQVSADDIKNAATDSAGNPWYEPKTDKVYLTSMSRTMKASEMTSDVFVLNAPDNKPVGTGETSGLGTKIIIGIITFLVCLVLILLSPFGLIFVVAVLAQIMAKSKLVKIIGWVFQAIFMLALLAFSGIFILILINAQAFSHENLSSNNFVYFVSALSAVFLVIVGEILAVVYQIKHLHREEEKNSQVADRIFDVKRK